MEFASSGDVLDAFEWFVLLQGKEHTGEKGVELRGGRGKGQKGQGVEEGGARGGA